MLGGRSWQRGAHAAFVRFPPPYREPARQCARRDVPWISDSNTTATLLLWAARVPVCLDIPLGPRHTHTRVRSAVGLVFTYLLTAVRLLL